MHLPVSRRTFSRLAVAPAAALVIGSAGRASAAGTTPRTAPAPASARTRGEIAAAVDRVTTFMDEHVSYGGGYVWSYLPDLSTTWGEMEARRTMCWIQPPGTPSVGHSLLDAYHATGSEACYRAAKRTGLALVDAQLACGGWNYIHDTAGQGSLRKWYETIGANGWRLEEFQHFYGNATFDDAATSTTAQLILRLQLERPHPKFEASLDRAIRFVVAAQYRGGVADGGWPQRFPAFSGSVEQTPWPDELPPWLPSGIRHGMEDGDYTGHVTFNDNVLGENIKFLLMCVSALGRRDLIPNVRRAMACLHRMQQPGPQAGWGLQHLARAAGGRAAGAPAGARSYEPRALVTHTTQTNVSQLFAYFRLTGDHEFLRRVPEAIAWLESCRLTDQQKAENPLLASSTHPTFVELGTNRARFVHRFGSNIRNGAYYNDYDHRDTPSHYGGGRKVDTAALRATYEELMAMSRSEVADLKARSPLSARGRRELPEYFSMSDLSLDDLFRDADLSLPTVTRAQADAVVEGLGDRDHWLTPIGSITNPYRGPAPATPYDGKAYMSRNVGDVYDTSPYDPLKPPLESPYTPQAGPLGITTSDFTENLGTLTAYIAGS
ncbi:MULTISPECIES: pectate lyase [unclassified Streptomyces]|uniref:pectate lyase n=1 Tax=unclassified Streptomyces TaxID=2593676 RepID=UPI0029BEEF40|nr:MULTISPECIES: pectate lyase [unclassified Streptomyces]MDX3819227.1 pectate lyase [Streptomyces sp. AK08-01A]